MVNGRQCQIHRRWFGVPFRFQIDFVVADGIVADKGSAQRIISSWETLRKIGSILMHLEFVSHTGFYRQWLPVQPGIVGRECLFQCLHYPCSLLVEVLLALY